MHFINDGKSPFPNSFPAGGVPPPPAHGVQQPHGTTTVAFKIKDAVVVAADRRVSMGSFLVMSKRAKKIHQLNGHTVMTISGGVADAQYIIKLMQAEINLYEYSRRRPPTTSMIGHLLATVLYGQYRSYMPYMVQLLVGGYDSSGAHVFSMDPAGSFGEDDYTASGSGSIVGFGVLETLWKKNMTKLEGISLAAKVIKAATERDLATGNGIDMMVITKDGVEQITAKAITEGLKL